jgi:hypothetical protein
VLFLFKEAQASACALYFPFRTRPVAHAPFSNEKKVVARISRYSLFTTHYSLLTFCLCSFFSTSPNLKTQSKEKSMSSLSPKDRVSLCLFTFEDGRRCRTPRTGNHPHFCFYHAQKESRAQAADKLAKDLACFFSGDYLTANDLSTALSRLIPATIRGDIKPRLARTVAYMVQTQLQAIHLSQHEYINAFGTDGWRKAVRKSVNVNYDYRFPPDQNAAEAEPAPQQPAQTPAQSPARPATETSVGTARPTPTTQPSLPVPTSSPAPARIQPLSRASAAQPHAPTNAQPPQPNSAPAQLAEPNRNPAAHTPQPASLATPPNLADEALLISRPPFRRRHNTTPVNPFKINIYSPPRNY